jgi:hypothetical protein
LLSTVFEYALSRPWGSPPAAIHYEGVNTTNEAAMKVVEFLHVEDGKIVGLRALILANGTEVIF